jgi:3-hydroxybutyryl-CoA dehydrogenase
MKLEQVKNVAVLGTGNMGPGIALVFAGSGYKVAMWGPTEKDQQDGIGNFRANVDDMVREGLMTKAGADETHALTTVTHILEDAAEDADFIVESIPEVLELKQDMFAELETMCKPDTIFASNTSTLLPTPLQEKVEHRDRVIVTHFWNPAYLVPLVEVCGSPVTSQETVGTTMGILKKIGNEPVLMRKEILGFIGNRIMHAMNREALALIDNGVCDPEDIDRVILSSFGPRFANLGPMEYLDFSGLDLIKSIQGYLYGDLDTTGGVLPVVERLVAEGKLGRKTGKGLFDWSRKEDRIRENRDKEYIRRKKEQLEKT